MRKSYTKNTKKFRDLFVILDNGVNAPYIVKFASEKILMMPILKKLINLG